MNTNPRRSFLRLKTLLAKTRKCPLMLSAVKGVCARCDRQRLLQTRQIQGVFKDLCHDCVLFEIRDADRRKAPRRKDERIVEEQMLDTIWQHLQTSPMVVQRVKVIGWGRWRTVDVEIRRIDQDHYKVTEPNTRKLYRTIEKIKLYKTIEKIYSAKRLREYLCYHWRFRLAELIETMKTSRRAYHGRFLTVENVTLADLVEKALSLSRGWFVEVYVKDGRVLFSYPLTSNSSMNDPDLVGSIGALRIGDVEGFYVRQSGRIEIEDVYSKSWGEHFYRAKVVTKKEALSRIAEIAYHCDWPLKKLLIGILVKGGIPW